jgi:beta-N-acetylglucosaminidase
VSSLSVGIPVVKNYGVIDVDGAPAIVLDRITRAVSSYDAILFNKTDSLKKVLNKQSIEDLQLIRSKLVEYNMGASDFQVVVRNDGRVFANDPGRIFNGVDPGNLSYIDKIIKLAQ